MSTKLQTVRFNELKENWKGYEGLTFNNRHLLRFTYKTLRRSYSIETARHEINWVLWTWGYIKNNPDSPVFSEDE